ncbi:MAG: CYTH domain-containing protein [Vicinamibacteria bacterium]|nr:CYTH domain-containing protein [Vicinamibacteria bacterium]
MATEIERRFLVKPGLWVPKGPGAHFQQGYLNSQKERVVRVRIEGSIAKLTIKGPSRGGARAEFEYGIPLEDAGVILNQLCERPLIDKHRHVEHHLGRAWEIDVFHGENEGLVIAEVELPSVDTRLELPPWAGDEVSNDPRYFNSNLLKSPYATWSPP